MVLSYFASHMFIVLVFIKDIQPGFKHVNKFWCSLLFICRVSQEKGINKKLLVGAAHDFNPQFLNLFGFSISVSFVWCIIWKIRAHLVGVTAVVQRRTCFLAFKFSRKTAIQFQKCFCVTLFQEFVTDYHFGIIWVCLDTNV